MSSYPATNVVTFSQLFCLARASSTGHMRSHTATPSQPSLKPHPLASSHYGISPVVSNISGTCYPVMPHRVQRHRTWALAGDRSVVPSAFIYRTSVQHSRKELAHAGAMGSSTVEWRSNVSVAEMDGVACVSCFR
jgi:hypothetical protein